MHETAHLLLGQSSLDFGCYYRVLDECHGLRTVRDCVFSERRNRGEQGTDDEAACREIDIHGLSLIEKGVDVE